MPRVFDALGSAGYTPTGDGRVGMRAHPSPKMPPVRNKYPGHQEMISRRTLFPFIVLILALVMGGCRKAPEPTVIPLPSPAATPQMTFIPKQVTPEPTLAPQVYPPGQPTPAPILYKMFDFGTDLQKLHPEYGPVGSIHWTTWERINGAPDSYNWDIIDSKLALEAPLKVTLPDGREIPKPVVLQVFAHISSAPNWGAEFYDATPRWVYDRIDRQKPDDKRPVVGGRPVGHTLTGCGKTAVLPMYDNQTWREAYYKMVGALGERYNNHPQVTAVVICTGLDGETQVVKDWSCQWNSLLDQQAPDVRYSFAKFINEAMQVYHKAFPDKPLFINNAPGGSGMRKATSEYAASFEPPIGLKHSGLWVDLDSHKGYGNFVGSWDMIDAYSMTLPIWLESVFGLGSKEHRYWTYMAGLHYHPDAIDLHPEFFTQSEPEWLRFVVEHLGVTIDNTPDVWTVLRDAEFPRVDWGVGGTSGHPGDWTFWLYRREDAPQSATKRLMREEMPAAREHVYSRQARSTRQDDNNIFMSFDIDDAYPYVAQKPIKAGGGVHYLVHVTILNTGDDTFSLQYRDWSGGIVEQTRRKGLELGPVDDWVEVTFVVEDGYFDNNMPGNTDLRISCNRDGDEIIHKVIVKGGWGLAPTPTPIPPTPTPTATPTGPTPTPLPPPTLVATPTVMPGAARFVPEADTYLDAWAPTSSRYNDLKLSARYGDIRAPLLRFNLSTIPPGAVVDQALLSLCVQGRSNDGDLSITAHKVLRPWKERECTWRQAQDGQPWTLAGCNDPFWDRSPVRVDGVTLTKDNSWVTWNLTPLVQEWVRDPAKNYGVVLKASGSTAVEYSFYASDYYRLEVRPHLWVAWHEASAETATPSLTPPPTETPASGPITITLRQGQDGYTGVFDTYLDAWAGNVNYVDDAKLAARQGSIRVPLLRFDLSPVPAGITIDRAILHLYVTNRSNSSALKIGIAKVVRPWDPAHVSWNRATASEAWAQPGAREVGVDRSVQLYASDFVDGEAYWSEWKLTALVQEWLLDPASNHGLMLLAEGGVSVQYDFASSEMAPEYRPYLEIGYTLTTPRPTPSPTATPTPQPATPTPTVTPLPVVGGYVFRQGKDGYEGCADTYVDRWNPQTNNALSDKLALRQGGVRSALIRFDLRAVPPDSYIEGARLRFHVRSGGRHELPLQGYAILRPWRIAEVTYQRSSREQAWYKEGLAPGQDISRDPLTSGLLVGAAQDITFDVTAIVRQWVAAPESNHGLLIKAGGDVATEYTLHSSEAREQELRPQLEITWQLTAPTPTWTHTPTRPLPTPTATLTRPPTPTPTATRPTTTVVLQQGIDDYAGATDTRLDAWDQSGVYGGEQSLNLRQTNIRVALVRFEIPPLPRGATVTGASLSLYAQTRTNAGSLRLRAYLMRRPWNEGAANWLEADTGRRWALPGANGVAVDRNAAPIAEDQFAGVEQWATLDVTQAVARWVQNPNENYGLLLRGEGDGSVDYRFASAQYWDASLRPKLAITYTTGTMQASVGDQALDVLPWLGLGAGLVALLVLIGRRFGSRRRAKRWVR